MAEFQRARSTEQKCRRVEQIKGAAGELFEQHPYHQITLTTIAEQLGWSRANLYKYVRTKEEIFLLIMADLRDAYTADLLDAMASLPTPEDAAAAWTDVCCRHRRYFRYADLLFTVIETNVSVEALMAFKRGYYEHLDETNARLSRALGVPAERCEELANTIYHHAVGLSGSCLNNPLVREAVAQLGVVREPVDFGAQMADFIAMCLAWYRRN